MQSYVQIVHRSKAVVAYASSPFHVQSAGVVNPAHVDTSQHDTRCTENVTSRRVRITTVAMDKQ
jgi:hypothetical protein